MRQLQLILIILLFASCEEKRYRVNRNYYYTSKEYQLKGDYPFRLWIYGDFSNDSLSLKIDGTFYLKNEIYSTINNPFFELTFEHDSLTVMRGDNLISKSYHEPNQYPQFVLYLNDEIPKNFMVNLKDGNNIVFLQLRSHEVVSLAFRQFKYMPGL